jgi:hypothetical protein
MTDNLFPIVLILEPTTTAVEYTVTVNTEWRLVYTMADAQSSTHEIHAKATQAEIGQVSAQVSETGGAVLEPAATPLTASDQVSLATAAGVGALGAAAVVVGGRAARARQGRAAAGGERPFW